MNNRKLPLQIAFRSMLLLQFLVSPDLMAQEKLKEADFDYFEINGMLAILPNVISVGGSGQSSVSSQVISRQNVNGDVGFVWNITFQYSFLLPNSQQIEQVAKGRRSSSPNTIEYRTYITHSVNDIMTTEYVDGGTTNIASTLAVSTDIEFNSGDELADYVASGPVISAKTVISFPQITSIQPDTNEVKEIVLDYLAANIISPRAPVLTSFNQLLKDYPDIVGRNPGLALSALASVFELSTIEIDASGEAKLVLPPAFEINVNQSFAAPRNLRFKDHTIASVEINLCESGEVLLLELGNKGCDKLDQLLEKFDR